ncbi:hypothetical protein BCR34DRAFT_593075 [Clohesyomyces aquaticus]|uniref:Uncharacterized protein n=1 Tax=Clohesyomyces aquaticus TaxID=1231657 RepID=A0A1Y1YLF5_9PLEO|nr:hypothetical protein BCR34DRAFT_593075 [Clohesyomyces aquaticus]
MHLLFSITAWLSLGSQGGFSSTVVDKLEQLFFLINVAENDPLRPTNLAYKGVITRIAPIDPENLVIVYKIHYEGPKPSGDKYAAPFLALGPAVADISENVNYIQLYTATQNNLDGVACRSNLNVLSRDLELARAALILLLRGACALANLPREIATQVASLIAQFRWLASPRAALCSRRAATLSIYLGSLTYQVGFLLQSIYLGCLAKQVCFVLHSTYLGSLAYEVGLLLHSNYLSSLSYKVWFRIQEVFVWVMVYGNYGGDRGFFDVVFVEMGEEYGG